MKKITWAILILILFTGTLLPGDDNTNINDIMHPVFSLLDKDGNAVLDESGEISTVRTCGQCHDTHYINSHNLHFNERVKADCIVCHFKESKMSGDYTKANLRIQLPSDQNCAACHGIVHPGREPLVIPDNYMENLEYVEGKNYYDITQRTGVILTHQDLSNSSINIMNKNQQDFSWDVHSRRQMSCISCHFIKNDPAYCGAIRTPLGHLTRDPRKVKPPHQYLKRPNHDLNTATCKCCHDPFAVHDHLPYKKRHMAVLSCQSCHAPLLYGPVFQAVDKTVVQPDGTARIEFRGVDETKSHGRSLNTKFYQGYLPFLFAHENKFKDRPGEHQHKISPFNLVTHWYWKSGKTGRAVPLEVLKKVYLKNPGPQYAEDVLKTFDKDRDKQISAGELVLDTEAKVNLIKEKLAAAGIEGPEIAGTIEAYPVNHGVVHEAQMKRDCSSCHGGASRFGRDVLLTAAAPGGNTPLFTENSLPLLNGEVSINGNGEVILKRTSAITGHYIFGHSRLQWLDRLGLWLFLLAVFFIITHGGYRFLQARKHPAPDLKTRTVYMYRFYERFWHWTMAAAVIILALTGLEIHYAGSFTLFGLEYTVAIHNVLAAILVINAALSLFYHLTTGEIKQFFGFNRKFIHETLVQTFYYIHDIFRRKPHPIHKTEERKLNPLQQLTYIGLLNLLLPFQVITGLLIWGSEKWPGVANALGGLTYLAPIHNLGAWLFLAFLAVHIYLTTTGHTVLSHIRAMVTGYEEVAAGEPDEEHTALMDMKFLDLTGTLIGRIAKKNKSR